MTFEEDYLRLLREINDFTRKVTGVPIIDAYFGPERFSQDKIRAISTPEELLADLNTLIMSAKDIQDKLKRIALTSDLKSLKVVVKWLSGEQISYSRLVEGIFGNSTQIRAERNPEGATGGERRKRRSSGLRCFREDS